MKLLQALPALALIVVTANSPARSALAKDEIKRQVEVSFHVSERLARQALDQEQFKKGKRTDYYADIYDGERFLLLGGTHRAELRLKVDEEKTKLQVGFRDATYKRSCGRGLGFEIKVKNVGQVKLGEKEGRAYAGLIRSQLRLLEREGGARALRNSVERLREQIEELDPPQLERAMNLPKDKHWIFAASHISRKSKWKRSIDDGAGEIVVSVTEAEDLFGDSSIQKKYEIEFQDEADMSSADFVRSICKYMGSLRIAAGDLTPTRLDPQAESLRQLEKYRGELGL